MEESILITIKKLLGIDEDCEDFDTDVMVHINSIFPVLTQLGVGPDEGFEITGDKEKWTDFLGTDSKLLGTVRSYLYLRTRMLFDPPVGSVATSFENTIQEFEWRLNVQVDPKKPTPNE